MAVERSALMTESERSRYVTASVCTLPSDVTGRLRYRFELTKMKKAPFGDFETASTPVERRWDLSPGDTSTPGPALGKPPS